MAQRKAPRGKSGTRPTPAAKTPSTKRASSGPPPRKPGKSIVNQRQTPWGLIVTAIVVVVFAVGIVAFAVTRHKTTSSSGKPFLNELPDAKSISGVTFRQEPNRNHANGVLHYDASPPVGGDHAPVWADCTGTVYANPIASENAGHSLEHGAVWITYQPGLDTAQVTALGKLVTGQDRLLLSPYPGLKTKISLQSWGYQLFVDSASDPRIQQFIDALRYNPKTTPEYGATCSNPTFKTNPSTPGNPTDA